MTTEWQREEGRVSGFENGAEPAETLRFPHDHPGQSYPRHYPRRPTDLDLSAGTPHPPDALGEPLSIRQVARLIGCSAWTVRHAYLPQGLPHFRSGPKAKLVFFRTQVVAWILEQQKRGGV